jgi:thiol-disulfide isomerase/thioredoxin
VSRLSRPARCAVPAAGRCGQPGAKAARGRTGAILTAAGLIAVVLTAAGCDGGPIGQNTPVSSGQGFVGSSYQSTIFKAGSRPAEPTVSGTTIAGQSLTLASYRGQVVVLNFWGSWCAPCRAEAPALGTLARQMYASGVRFVGIDIRDEAAAAQAFMQSFGISYPSLNDPSDEIALLFRATVPPAAIPSTIIVDRTGKIAARIVGSASYSGLKALIAAVEHG